MVWAHPTHPAGWEFGGRTFGVWTDSMAQSPTFREEFGRRTPRIVHVWRLLQELAFLGCSSVRAG
jgi:hypothetical protein